MQVEYLANIVPTPESQQDLHLLKGEIEALDSEAKVEIGLATIFVKCSLETADQVCALMNGSSHLRNICTDEEGEAENIQLIDGSVTGLGEEYFR
jgi:hypothetical protein